MSTHACIFALGLLMELAVVAVAGIAASSPFLCGRSLMMGGRCGLPDDLGGRGGTARSWSSCASESEGTWYYKGEKMLRHPWLIIHGLLRYPAATITTTTSAGFLIKAKNSRFFEKRRKTK